MRKAALPILPEVEVHHAEPRIPINWVALLAGFTAGALIYTAQYVQDRLSQQ